MSIKSGLAGRRRAGRLLISGLVAGMAGCGGEPPIDIVSNADLAVNQAMNAKAQQYAPAELQRALDKVARAKQAMADENYKRARRLAEEAQVDAQVAEAKARSGSARQTAREAQQTIDALRREAEERQGAGGTDNVRP
jgi:hypothetical protein